MDANRQPQEDPRIDRLRHEVEFRDQMRHIRSARRQERHLQAVTDECHGDES